MFDEIFAFIKSLYPTQKTISLHEPRFWGHEKEYVNQAIDSTFVSSVGEYVNKFESMLAKKLGVPDGHVSAVANGTCALHAALYAVGVKSGDLVITQPLTFIATCNAIKYLGAEPLFIDVDRDTLGLSPLKLAEFLETKCRKSPEGCMHKDSGKKIKACVPMHTFGHAVLIDQLIEICASFGIPIVEDAAESLGSKYKGKDLGTFGDLGVFSFNGNKIVTTGGGGAIYSRDINMAKRVKHLTTTAKIPHPWAFDHDEMGFNYRMPNLNAALGCAQLEQLDGFLDSKRKIAEKYKDFFTTCYKDRIEFVTESKDCQSNYWLNTILLKNKSERDNFLQASHKAGIFCRPVWNLMTETVIYQDCIKENIQVSQELRDRVVNLPSSVTIPN